VHAERGLAVGMRGRQSHSESLARELYGIGEPSLLKTDSKKHNRRLGTIIARERVPGMECCQPEPAVKQVLLSGSMTHGSRPQRQYFDKFIAPARYTATYSVLQKK
jgi:hypothetical protein